MSAGAKKKIKSETKALLNRWSEECDLEEVQIAKAVLKAVNKWLDEMVVEFEADFDIEEEE
jgi:hypothetical protein